MLRRLVLAASFAAVAAAPACAFVSNGLYGEPEESPEPGSEDAASAWERGEAFDAGLPANDRGFAGCYEDTLPRGLEHFLGDNHTPGSCRLLASRIGFKFAGVQDGGQCWTGDELRFDPVEPERCGKPCVSDGRWLCGGEWANAVYPTGAAGRAVAGRIDVEGFGEGSLGGWQDRSENVWVTNLDDSGPGSLRHATESGGRPRVVRFAVSGWIDLHGSIPLPSNISIDGRGADVKLRGKGFVIANAEHVIVTNITIANVFPKTEDGIQIVGSRNVVVDHVWFYAEPLDRGRSTVVDEAISVVRGSKEVTISWCKFEQWEKVMLFGSGEADAAEMDSEMTVTVHHNLARATGRRHPEARHGVFDVYNNLFYDWQSFKLASEDSFGAKCREGCRMLLEQNIWARKEHTRNAGTHVNYATWCAGGGVIEDRGQWTPPWNEAGVRYNVWCPAGTSIFDGGHRPYAGAVVPERAGEALRQRLNLAGPERVALAPAFIAPHQSFFYSRIDRYEP